MNRRGLRRAAEKLGAIRLSAVVFVLFAAGAVRAGAPAAPGPTAPENAENEGLRARAARGAEIFARRCTPCHGKEGRGDGPAAGVLDPRPRDFTDPAALVSENDAELTRVITEGGPALELSGAMPAWGKILSASQIRDLVVFVRTLADTAASERGNAEPGG